MKVILLDDIKNVGKKGDIINASDGYANNYLFPKKLAIEANKNNLNELDNKKKQVERKRIKEIEDARELAAKIKESGIQIGVKVGENGKLFGSVTGKEIAAALEQQHSLGIDRKRIDMAEPIKTLGTHTVSVKLHAEVTTSLQVTVVPSAGSAAAR